MFNSDDVISPVRLINSDEFVAQNNSLEFACESSGQLRKMDNHFFQTIFISTLLCKIYNA